MIFTAISILPQMFESLRDSGITKRAFDAGKVQLDIINPRDFVTDKYKKIDDISFGGGAGAVMLIEPLHLALQAATALQAQKGVTKPLVIYMSPQGVRADQQVINKLAEQSGIIMVCGRYEGVDERFIQNFVDLELSIGDFVVSGGELPAMLVIDATMRQLPGVVGKQESVNADSFMNGLLDYPHYSHPREYNNWRVPEVLLSGDHQQINLWRLQMSLFSTYIKRKDMLINKQLTQIESRLLEEAINIDKANKKVGTR